MRKSRLISKVQGSVLRLVWGAFDSILHSHPQVAWKTPNSFRIGLHHLGRLKGAKLSQEDLALLLCPVDQSFPTSVSQRPLASAKRQVSRDASGPRDDLVSSG